MRRKDSLGLVIFYDYNEFVKYQVDFRKQVPKGADKLGSVSFLVG